MFPVPWWVVSVFELSFLAALFPLPPFIAPFPLAVDFFVGLSCSVRSFAAVEASLQFPATSPSTGRALLVGVSEIKGSSFVAGLLLLSTKDVFERNARRVTGGIVFV